MSESDGVVDAEKAVDADSDEVVVFSDYVCPFCHLGRASLEQYREGRDAPLRVEWHPFDLRGYKRDENREIQTDVDDGKDDDYFEQVRENVERLSEEYGVDADIDAVPDTDSWNAQQAAFYVREELPERFGAFDDALFEAYWTDHRDIGDPDVIADVAESVGLDAAEIRDAATDDDWADRLEAQFQDARDRGVTGVPTFAADGHAARGAVPPAQLERLIEGEN
ncbi:MULTISPECIES: DsbA family oxidoreductase [Halolamina]|uniref:Predicted dithiol-disulfide isomerase, DsbA family n=1 Tax=Halolamina pelagica TaxID=699431 RepID=A0A1I5RUF6_9EURY|nr:MULTISPECIES: DsbA family protein [Halolamina]NHX35351.1 thioredoxin domain-containing protein [Halolamina sp. R1-12]SFP62164.1 Predicted dithiol-disulfide isomerase, DsbA family [Halolamina pelagica]